MGLISQEFAEKIYEDIISRETGDFENSEKEMLQKLLCSQVGIKALKHIHYYSLIASEQLMNIDMETRTGPHAYSRMQGKMQCANEIIYGLLGLITTPSEKEDE